MFFGLFKNKTEVKIMQGLEDLKANLDKIDGEIGSVKILVENLNKTISDLKDSIAKGGDNDADVEALAQRAGEQANQLDVIVNPPATPAV